GPIDGRGGAVRDELRLVPFFRRPRGRQGPEADGHHAQRRRNHVPHPQRKSRADALVQGRVHRPADARHRRVHPRLETRAEMSRAILAAILACLALHSHAKPWELIRADGEISACANPNALPYSSNKPDAPGFQVEIARALAERLGVRRRIEWIIPRMRASTVDCDLLMDTIAVPGVHPPSIKLSTPYYRGGVPLAFGRDQKAAPTYRALPTGTRVGVIMNSL